MFVFKDFLLGIFKIPLKFNYNFALNIGALIIAFPIIAIALISKNKDILKILLILISIKFLFHFSLNF